MSSGKTQQLTVNSVARTAIIAFDTCTDIQVQEDPAVASWPTTDYLVSKPGNADVQRRIPLGTPYTFHKDVGCWQKGDNAGYIQTVSGSTTFDQDEGGV